jgi:hypothetical protein
MILQQRKYSDKADQILINFLIKNDQHFTECKRLIYLQKK